MVTLPSPLQGKGKETAEDSMWYSWEGEIIETTELCDIKKKKKTTSSAESKNEVAYSLSHFLHFVKNSVE